MTAAVEIVFYSANDHTLRQAEALRDGAAGAAAARLWRLGEEGSGPDGMWDALDAADAIVLGSPTYMGGPAWQMKRFADESSGRWLDRAWQDKLAGGFVNGGAPAGNSTDVLTYFWTLASQHGMIWTSLGQAPANTKDDDHHDRNWLGGAGGAMAQSPVDADANVGPRDGDLISARDYGRRLADLATIVARGRQEVRQAA